LHLGEVVRCHPASRYLELHFDLQDAQVEGVTLFEVFSDDTTWIGNLPLEPDGVFFILSERMGDTITLRQVGETACSREFVVPACTESVCPLQDSRAVEPMDCEGDMAHYQFIVRHDPPIEIPSTDFAVYNEHNDFLEIYSLGEADSIVHLFIPASLEDRKYRLCDLFNPEGCCIDVILPGIDCNALPTGVIDLGEIGVKVYPNPASDHIVLDLGDGLDPAERLVCRITDAAGRPFATSVISARVSRVATEAYPPGIYLVGLYRNDALLGYQRFVKMR
jgi:hypothetical protein